MSYLSSLSGASRSPKSESFSGPTSLAHNAPLPNTPLRPNDNDTAAYTPARRPPSRRSQRAVPSPLKAAAILLAFLPIPPTLSVIYIACGHVVLRAAHQARYGAVPLISSVRAAAAGGAILALPLAVLLYLLFFPTKPPDPEDFFDDDEDTGETLTRYKTYAACAVLLLVLGAISGALGTVCLPDDLMLTAAEAAEAGVLGGAIICGTLASVALMTSIFWWDFFSSRTLEE